MEHSMLEAGGQQKRDELQKNYLECEMKTKSNHLTQQLQVAQRNSEWPFLQTNIEISGSDFYFRGGFENSEIMKKF